ncbi:hypothetical protein [Pseudomonas sp. GW456-L14]|uniref:hypothetical protein n=3 Tax=unclassified Pseudomonas TaxID=196821 RepID=UPI0011AF16F6|nr:hypothetical protein [Pseudomonas sp. GW456-L14]
MPKVQASKDKASLKKQTPRVRKRHPDSEGESESECSKIGYRALRKDEEPLINGIKPPANSDPKIPAFAHVRAGSKAKVKSRWVSYSRSLKVAGSWAAKDLDGRVVKFKVPKGRKFYDLTTARDQQVFLSDYTKQTGKEIDLDPKKHPAINFAKGSQEGLIYNGVEASDVIAVYSAERISDESFRELSLIRNSLDSWRLIKSRATVIQNKVKALPEATLLTEIYNKNDWLVRLRLRWDRGSRNAKDDLAGQGLSPYDINYISNYKEYRKYKEELKIAYQRYLDRKAK